MTKAILQIGYVEFLLDASAAQKVFEALDGRRIETDYFSAEDAALYECSRGRAFNYSEEQRMSCVLVGHAEMDSMQERYNAKQRYEMRKSLEEADARLPKEWTSSAA